MFNTNERQDTKTKFVPERARVAGPKNYGEMGVFLRTIVNGEAELGVGLAEDCRGDRRRGGVAKM